MGEEWLLVRDELLRELILGVKISCFFMDTPLRISIQAAIKAAIPRRKQKLLLVAASKEMAACLSLRYSSLRRER